MGVVLGVVRKCNVIVVLVYFTATEELWTIARLLPLYPGALDRCACELLAAAAAAGAPQRCLDAATVYISDA